MSDKMKNLLTPEWIWRYLVAFALVANLYLQSRYVTRDEYVSDKKELSQALTALNTTMVGNNTALELLKQSSLQLGDHEARLRLLERKP
jgi:hypothetical protein